MHSITAPKVISNPASRTLTSRPDDSSISMPAGASTEQPVTIFPSIKAVGAKRRCARCGLSMQMHVGQSDAEEKGSPDYFARAASTADFPGYAGLRAANPLLYRCFPLTCARTQE